MFDANVACKMMGMGRAKKIQKFGAGSGKIWLDDLRCAGHEDSLFHCTHSGVGVENCKHSEDIGVVCKGKLKQSIKIVEKK